MVVLQHGCRFFNWHDAPMCARGRQVIPSLLRRVLLLEDELNEEKRNSRKLWMLVIMALLIVGWLLFGVDDISSGVEGIEKD